MTQYVLIFEPNGSSNRYSVQFLEEKEYGQILLQRARSAKKKIICACNSNTSPILYTRQSGTRLILCRNPDSGPDHDPSCDDYEEDTSKSGRRNYTKDAIEETTQGYTIHLGVALCRVGKAPMDHGLSPATPNAPTGRSYRRIGLYGLLHFLWSRAKLHMWRWNEKREWSDVANRLAGQIAKVSVGGSELSEKVILPRTSNSKEVEEKFNAIKAASATPERLDFRVFIGHLLKAEERKSMMRLTFENIPGNAALWVTKATWDYALSASSHHGLKAAVEKADHKAAVQRLVAIGRVEVTDSGFRTFVDLRLMVTSKDFIPVDSSYEAQVADLLVGQGRRFEKPLMYDSDDEVFPDFVLTDAHPNIPMEIWGITNNPKYDERKAKKLAHYHGNGGVWEWDAGAGNPIPQLPT